MKVLSRRSAVVRAVEVISNIHRWNADMARPDLWERWRRRPVRYFAQDPSERAVCAEQVRRTAAELSRASATFGAKSSVFPLGQEV